MTHLLHFAASTTIVIFVLSGCEPTHSADDGHAQGASAAGSQDGHDHDADESVGAVSDAVDHQASENRDRDGDHEEDSREHDDATGAGPRPDAHADGEPSANHLELSPTQRERIGLEIATAQSGAIDITSTFPGEIILNPERMAHLVPRASGVVREVDVSLGDYVERGEILAWIESDELAEAKLAFYAAHAEIGCCQIELPRALEIFQNTNKLLLLLEKEPTSPELRELKELEMAEYRGRLLTAYSEYVATKKTFESERGLFEKSISSERELIEAEAAFKKAQAQFEAAKDTARYQVLIAYTEAARKRQVAEFAAVASAQRLRLQGVTDEVLSRLLALVPNTASLEPCLCDDPDCKDGEFPSVIETLGEDERLGWYALRAPFAGFITEKHLTLGEKVGDDESVMTIADTSTIWVRFSVYQKDLSRVERGQNVRIDLGAGMPSVTGAIAYVSPIVDKDTRTSQARVELENPDGLLRPGLYATVQVAVGSVDAPVIIHRDAVQVLDNQEVVFIEDGDGFISTPVRLGRSEGERVTVLAGLERGQRYVAGGAFEMKAKITSSGLGAHAGHGH